MCAVVMVVMEVVKLQVGTRHCVRLLVRGICCMYAVVIEEHLV